jgi:hypothetical protein
MPFDFEEYKSKCSTLSPEELQKEWENYTRHIAGSATSTAGSVLFAPLTAGASLVGLGLSTPRIHNARKKRAIIEEHLQAHGMTHHTRKRDVVAPMAVAGTLGGLTLGFAGAGADLLGRQAAEKGVEYFVSHAALEAAGATLEHKHDKSKKMKDQEELAKKYGDVEGPAPDQKTTLLSPRTSVRKSKSETYLGGLAYGSLPGEKRPKKPPRPHQASQPDIIHMPVPLKSEDSPTTGLSSPLEPGSATQIPQKEDQKPEEPSESCMKLPYLGLTDHDEAEQLGLLWDPTRGMYVKPNNVDPQQDAEGPSLSSPLSHVDLKTAQHQSDELEDLLSQLLMENSTVPGDTSAAQIPQVSLGSASKQSIQLQTSNPVVPEEKSPSLPLRPESLALPPRPKSSTGSYSTPVYQTARPERHSYIPPPPPPQQPSQQQAGAVSTQPQYNPLQHYNPRQYSPSPSLSPLPVQAPYQPARVQFPQYQYYPPPPPFSNQVPLPPPPARRPGPQPLQHQQSQAYAAQRQDSNSSISTVSSSSTFNSLASVSTVSAASTSTPLTSYSASLSTQTTVPSHSYDPAFYDVSPKPAAAKLCLSPKPAATTMYFPPPPTSVVAENGGKGRGRDYFG